VGGGTGGLEVHLRYSTRVVDSEEKYCESKKKPDTTEAKKAPSLRHTTDLGDHYISKQNNGLVWGKKWGQEGRNYGEGGGLSGREGGFI